MGYIYSKAHEVIAVLSHTVLPSLAYMQENKQLSEQHMFALERDEWVTRAWTYQEAVNARCLFITCEDPGDIIITGQNLMSYLGYTLVQLTIPPLERRARYPRLDALEDLVDYLTAAYEERSALQAMAKMDRRFHGRPEDHFYAMIGAISSSLGSSTGAVSACEAFIRICERKGDFSFIYSGAPRASEAGRRWRPVPGDLPALLQWDCFGVGEPGRITENGLLLENVVKLSLGDMSTKADKFARDWLTLIGKVPEGVSQTDIPAYIFDALGLMGFTGPGDFLATSVGLFFPIRLVSTDQPPPYGDTDGSNRDDVPSSGASERPIEKQKRSFSQRLFGLFRTHSKPEPQDDAPRTRGVEILVQETRPNILEVVAHRCGERSRRVTVEVQVSATATARSRPAKGRSAVASSKTCLVKRTAQAPYLKSTRDHFKSVAMATEMATRKAAEEAHRRAVSLATMSATARTLEKVAVQGRVG
ncbi:hypothetical protein VMCG_02494 [Cytospora schulzeri]|uniref:Heterokaryon incompatibility domain-containing protein n=1 Tax=Cytospora schulzeri TaxID=448051 RepID=A0A423X1R2_9PEZI|nr:hypothetical protein VMCG_02494 [Valsa malicola]